MREGPLRVLLLLVVVLSCAALSGSGPAAGRGGTPPWDPTGDLPARYDLRDVGWVTPVRWQQHYGTCPSMAAVGSLESNLLRAEGVELDLSENNLADRNGSRLGYEGMMPSEIAAAYFARWEGPVLERDDPYPAKGGSPEYLRAVRHVQEVLFLPPRSGPLDNTAIKWAVKTYGAVDASIAFDTRPQAHFWNSPTDSYYSTGGAIDHHVCCVGWDDGYPASRFALRPPGDGAFLIKNSWGKDFGDRGYFWISYYDTGFGAQLAVFDGVEPVDDHDAIYQYDALGRSDWLGLGGEDAWFANRFRCAGSGSVTAVSFYTPAPGAAYEVRVAGSLGGLRAAPVVAAGTMAAPGYHTVDLARAVPVLSGRRFVIAVHVTTPGWDRPVPVERPTAYVLPRALPGQSYVSADGTGWTDLTTRTGPGYRGLTNVCLKAFVDTSGPGDRRAPRVTVAATSVRQGERATVHWTLTDPAFSSASAVVVLEVRDRDGVELAAVRIPAVAVGERDVWTFVARWQPGTYVVTGAAYDVAGRQQTIPGRAVLVVRAPAGGVTAGR